MFYYIKIVILNNLGVPRIEVRVAPGSTRIEMRVAPGSFQADDRGAPKLLDTDRSGSTSEELLNCWKPMFSCIKIAILDNLGAPRKDAGSSRLDSDRDAGSSRIVSDRCPGNS